MEGSFNTAHSKDGLESSKKLKDLAYEVEKASLTAERVEVPSEKVIMLSVGIRGEYDGDRKKKLWTRRASVEENEDVSTRSSLGIFLGRGGIYFFKTGARER